MLFNVLFVIPMLIQRFQAAYTDIKQLRKEHELRRQTNYIIASFIMLDIDNSNSISKSEFKNLFQIPTAAIDLDFEAKKEFDLSSFIQLLLNERLTLEDPENDSFSNIVVTSQFQTYLECKVFSNPWHDWISLLFGVGPLILASTLWGLYNVDTYWLAILMITALIYNIFDVLIKVYSLGSHSSSCSCNCGVYSSNSRLWSSFFKLFSFLNVWKYRYFNFVKFSDPPMIQWCILEKLGLKQEFSSLIYLTKNDIQFCNDYLKDFLNANVNVSHYSDASKHYIDIWFRKRELFVNLVDFGIVLSSIIGIICCIVFKIGLNEFTIEGFANSSNNNNNNDGMIYLRLFINLPIFRLLTLVQINKQLGFEMVNIISKWYHIIIFAFLYVVIWARIGVTLFYGKSELIADDIYTHAAYAKFNSLTDGILALVQVMMGNSWGNILTVNVLATSIVHVSYFVSFVLFITIFVVNIFVGLVLSGIEDLEKQIDNNTTL